MTQRIRGPNETVGEYNRRYKAELYSNPQQRERIRKRRRMLYQERAHTLEQLKNSIGCQRCGSQMGPFEFHHVDPNSKSFWINPSGLIGHTTEEQWAEVRKCVIVCRSCHAKAHHREQNICKSL